MNISIRHGLTVPALMLLIGGCGTYHENYMKDGLVRLTTGTTPGFAEVQAVFARNKCLDCHTVARGNMAGVNLETFASTAPLAARIKASLLSDRMPLGGPPMVAEDKATVITWVDGGAPETGTGPDPGTPPAVDFAVVRTRIFEPHCIRCHSGFGAYATVTGRLNSIQGAVESNRMPMGGPPLPDELKHLLSEWIRQGAPEDLNNPNPSPGPYPDLGCNDHDDDDDDFTPVRKGDDDDCPDGKTV